MADRRRWDHSWLVRSIAALALAYFIAGKLGLQLASVHEHVTAVWPPSGVALAALLLWGYRLWPGVLIGSFLVNVTTGENMTLSRILASSGIAAGSTLQGLLGAYLVNRFARGRRPFDRAQDVFAFAALTAIASTTVAATVGVTSLSVAGLAKWADAFDIWVTWWIGDGVGDLLFAPPLILWAADPRLRWSRSQALEAGLLLLAVCVLALSAFTNVLPPRPPHMGLAFLCTPALLWAAFRFGQRETATAMLVVSGVAVWGAQHGLQAARFPSGVVLLELQAYLGVTSVTILAVAAEVSQRRQNELALERLAETLRQQAQLLDLAPVVVLDRDGRIILWNSGAERLYGFTPEEAVGKISHRLLQTRFQEPLEEMRAKLLAHGSWEGELEQTARDGRQVVVASLWMLHRDKTGVPTAILEVNSDITELKRTEQARLQLATRQAELLQEISRLQKSLLDSISHDLRTPLASITGALSTLSEDNAMLDEVTRRELLETSREEAARLNRLLGNLLDMTRLEAGTVRAETELCDVQDVIGTALAQLGDAARKRVIRVDLPPDLPLVPMDFVLIAQVLVNLLDNAIKYSPVHEPITIQARVAGDVLEVEVADRGIGIPESELERVFEKFHRGVQAGATRGTGLGLSICKGFVEAHGGRIRAERDPERGTVFAFTLPGRGILGDAEAHQE